MSSPRISSPLKSKRGSDGRARGLAALDLAPGGDALARAERESGRGALGLAEAALDALVDECVRGRQRLQVPEVGLGVVVLALGDEALSERLQDWRAAKTAAVAEVPED